MKASAVSICACAALALLSFTAAARAAETGNETASDTRTAYVGVEVGNTDTHRWLAGAALRWKEHWELDGQVARAQFDLPEISTSSTVASGQLQYDLGPFGASIGYRRGELEAVSTTSGWNLGATYRRDALRFGVEIESRDTSLEPTPFTEDLGDGLGIRSGTSRCEVDSRGYQAQVNLDRPAWLGFLTYKIYDYQDFDCELTLTGSGPGNGNGPPAHARGRALGRRLGETALRPVTGFASRLIPREAMLLDWSAAVGVTLPVSAEWIGGAELYRDVERVDASTVDTALVFASRRLNETWTMELSLGFSDAEGVRDTAFAGIRMSADL